MDKLMKDQIFRKKIAQECRKLRIGEKITRARQQAHLSQAALAKRIHATKKSITRYERADYYGHRIAFLVRIAAACGKALEIKFVLRRATKRMREA